MHTLEGHTNHVTSVAINKSGVLASASRDKTIKLWDTASGTLLRSLKGHADFVNAVTFNDDGYTVVSASFDDSIKLWNGDAGTLISSLKGHTNIVWSVAVSKEHVIASASSDNTVKLWKPELKK